MGFIEIPLSHNQVTIIDDIDAELVGLKWYAAFAPNYGNGGKFIVVRNIRTSRSQSSELMHRAVLSRMLERKLLTSEQVDHINGDPLDNRRSNLRLATHAENQRNKGRYSNNTSGYKGVSWAKKENKWQAQISFNGKVKYLGYFATAEDAYESYCKAAKELHGEYANLGDNP